MKHVWKPTRSLLAVLTACASLSALTASGQTVPPPAPYGALPSQGQLQWHEMEMYNMIEFNQINYLDKDWGWGDESPEIVNPVNFNAEEIVLRAKKAGSKGFLINAKHHGGFCMCLPARPTYNISPFSLAQRKRRLGRRVGGSLPQARAEVRGLPFSLGPQYGQVRYSRIPWICSRHSSGNCSPSTAISLSSVRRCSG